MHRHSKTKSTATRFASIATVVALAGLAGVSASAKATQTFGLSAMFKVSHYNNLKPDLRRNDLLALNRIAAQRPDRYHTEGETAVTDAIGMRRPDEVVILF